MPSKTNSKPPKASKTSISSEKSMEKKPLEQKQNVEKEKKVREKASDKTNSIEFNARLWENLYYLLYVIFLLFTSATFLFREWAPQLVGGKGKKLQKRMTRAMVKRLDSAASR